ncbi:MAG: hypothetical protein C5B49_12720, partial [Bdellovibrio sp.]
YFYTPEVFVARKDWPNDEQDFSPEGLAGKGIAVPRATSTEYYLEDNYQDARILIYDTFVDCMAALESKRADLVFFDEASVAEELNFKPHNAKIVSEPIDAPNNEGFAIGVALGNEQLLGRLQSALDKFRGTQGFLDLFDKYFGSSRRPYALVKGVRPPTYREHRKR